jgi:hypothetical protein
MYVSKACLLRRLALHRVAAHLFLLRAVEQLGVHDEPEPLQQVEPPGEF